MDGFLKITTAQLEVLDAARLAGFVARLDAHLRKALPARQFEAIRDNIRPWVDLAVRSDVTEEDDLTELVLLAANAADLLETMEAREILAVPDNPGWLKLVQLRVLADAA